jgi:DNA polymerase V
LKTPCSLEIADDKFIDHYLTSVGHKTVLELRGFACIELDEAPPAKKSILCSKSFSKQVTDQQELAEAVSTYVTRATEKLRKQKSLAGYLMVFLNTNRFKDGPQYNNSVSTTFLPPTAYTPDLIKARVSLLDDLYLPALSTRKRSDAGGYRGRG